MEKILKNYHILESIFRYLDFKEHLKLLKISPQFEYAIVHGVWRLMCNNLYILQNSLDTFLLKYNAENNVMTERSLTLEEFHTILHHSSMYIQKLELIKVRCLKNIISFNYHHLTELSLRDTIVEGSHLQQVTKNCQHLQCFSLINFTNSINHSNIRANVFGQMKALNKLEISDINFSAWNYFDVQQLFCLVHLKTLMINIDIRDSNDNKGNNNNSTDRVYNIENLTIGALPCLQSTFFKKDLIRFENLTKLSITLKQGQILILDDIHLTQINHACPKLCELSFTEYYLKFKEFPRMNNLKHLTFKWCSSARFENFDDIFRKLKLKSLTLVGVRMRDKAENIFNYNYTSNTLETLNIQDIDDDRNIVTTFCNRQHKFENVSKIRLSESPVLLSESTGLCFSHNFPYLQELIMDAFFISSEDILHLEHLKILQFDLFYSMSWSYLEILFKHPTLTHITITPSCFQIIRRHYERSPICCEGLTTTLEYLSLPSEVYESALNFWPSFRQRNKLLKLEVVNCDPFKSKAAVMR